MLSEIYGIPAVQDRQWEETKDYYAHTVRNCELSHISHLGEYLKAVSNPDYSVFISVREDAVTGLTEEIKQYLKEFGLKTDLSDKHRYSYYAVIVPGQPVIEAASKEALTATGSFRDGRSVYKIVSQGYYAGKSATIEIDGRAYSKNGRGFNMVVYDHVTMKVIDQVRFDAGGTNAIR